MTKDPAKLEEMLDTIRATAGVELANHPMRTKWEDLIRSSPEELRKCLAGFSANLQREICKRRIYCLTPDPCSTLMWSHYAENHRGICLEFHVGNPLFIKARKVTYCSEYPVWVPQEMLTAADRVILTKSKDWEYEEEFRLIGSPYYADGNPLKPEGDFFRLPPRSLQSVIVGCEGDYEAVKKIVHDHSPGLPVKRASRVPNHYRLEIITPAPDPSGSELSSLQP